MDRLACLYRQYKGLAPQKQERLAGAGSNREYWRLTVGDGATVIGVIGTSREENEAFVYLARHFRSHGLQVPEVYAVSDDGMCYLQQDLGSVSLFDAIKKGRESGGNYDEAEQQLLVRTVRELPRMQFEGAKGLDFDKCYPVPSFDRESIFFDLNYFKYCFLKATGLDFNEVRLEEAFRQLADDLLKEDFDSFMYRDFQARNVMLGDDGTPWFIDFQGGRRGPFYYDLASFLWQASARYGCSLRTELAEEYYKSMQMYTAAPPKAVFNERLRLFVLFRIIQVLGAYGFRGYFERKRHFIDSIIPAVDNLRTILADGGFPYPYLVDVLGRLTALEQYQPNRENLRPTVSEHDGKGALVVRVFSFSYKKGIPEDESGNGGGYVFDCRSTHNPGRYEPYKKLTGLDEPVIHFLEDDGEILTFLESVYKLADAHVERYMKRGFTDLMFSFGCTGGQHRSVYSAQHLAEHLHSKYGIEVRVCHREQGIKEVLK